MSEFIKGAVYARDSILRLIDELMEGADQRFASWAVEKARECLQKEYNEILSCFGAPGKDSFKDDYLYQVPAEKTFSGGAKYGLSRISGYIKVGLAGLGYGNRFSPEYQSLQWLSNAIDEKCATWGNELREKALESLAVKLNDFYKDFDFYDYMDSVGCFENQEDALAELVRQLEDAEAVGGILDTLVDIKENGELSEEQRLMADELVLDLAELQVKLGKSVSDVLAEAVERSEISDRENMLIDILQVKQGDAYRDSRFAPIRCVPGGASGVQFEHYNYVYHYSETRFGSLEDKAGVMELLEDVYAKFNLRHPDDFKGHSLSVSDVVVLTKGGLSKAFYCDSFGFEELPDLFVKAFAVEKANAELERN